MGQKLTFDDALQLINDERSISADQVSARALSRVLWVAEWHLPGCMSESRAYCLTKRDAIESACQFAEGENGAPRGMATALRRFGRFDSQSPMFGTCINTIERVTLRDVI
jgi:hypothetical protein